MNLIDTDGNLALLAITGLIGLAAGGIYGYVKTGTLQGTLTYAAIGGIAGVTLGTAGSLIASTAMGGASLTLTTAQAFSGFSALVQGGTAATLWGASRNGVNQGIRHFFEYATEYSDRFANVSQRLNAGIVDLTRSGFTTFTNAAMNVVNNYQSMGGLMRQIGEKTAYYYNNVVIIMYGGKLQSVMEAGLKYFNKMK